VIALLLLAACAPPDTSTMFHVVDVHVTDDSDEAHGHFVETIEAAQERLAVMLPTIEDTALSDAIVSAADRGVEVEVVVDVDNADADGALALAAADVPLQLADGDITYFEFSVGDMVAWDSTETFMTHAVVIADEKRFTAASTAGQLDAGWRVVLTGTGEDLSSDLADEHVQIFGGTDATSLTTYSSLAKSISDHRWRYPTETEVDLEMWLGPQERLVKRVVDAVYSAKSDVRVLTNDLTDPGLAKALQAKAADGFTVEVVVGPAFGTNDDELSAVYLDEAPDVPMSQVGDEVVPTVVLVDFGQARDGQYHRPRAMVLTHDLFAASRLYTDDQGRTETILTDQLIDGTLWSFDVYDAPSEELLLLEELWNIHRDAAQEL